MRDRIPKTAQGISSSGRPLFHPSTPRSLNYFPDLIPSICGTLVCAGSYSVLILNKYTRHYRLCSLHNEVNKHLHKPQFDCAHLDEEYDCGCGDEPINGAKAVGGEKEDLDKDLSEDELTGIEMINGGR